MGIVDFILRGIWTLCGVVGFICICSFVGFAIIAVADNNRCKKIENNIKRFKGENND